MLKQEIKLFKIGINKFNIQEEIIFKLKIMHSNK